MNNLPDSCTDLNRILQEVTLKMAIDEINRIKKENARLREAMESIYYDGVNDDTQNYSHKWFNIARQALKGSEE
jgi:hypothetical protein